MSKLSNVLSALQPYFQGIRYYEGVPVVDVRFKDGWVLPSSELVKTHSVDVQLNSYLVYSEQDVTLDDLLTYIEATIKINNEREKKHELLKLKVEELKTLFKTTQLSKLYRLKFIIGDEDYVPKIDEFDLDNEIPEMPMVEEEVQEQPIQPPYPVQPIKPLSEMTEEEIEEEEAITRAENFKRLQEHRKANPVPKNIVKKNGVKVELPPKKNSPQLLTFDNADDGGECECGPNEACGICIAKKDL